MESVNSTKDSRNEKRTFSRMFSMKQLGGLLIGPILFALVLLAPLPGLSFEGKGVLATLVWVIVWWVTECSALGATSLIPMVVLPILGSVSAPAAAKAYADPLVMLFLAGFAIALAIEKWNLHERIALTVISFFGGSLSGIILGVLVASAFISMWVSNTATVMMLLPIGTAVSEKIVNLMKEEGVYTKEEEKNFTSALILGIAIGSTVGGSATLIGTPPNLILAGLVQEIIGIEIPFGKWMIFAAPMCFLLLLLTTFYFTKIGFPLKVKKLEGGKEFIISEKRKLGKMCYEEKVISVIFAFVIFFWLTRTFIWTNIIPGISDTMIAVAGAILMYVMPASKKNGGRILEGDSFGKMPWSVLLMVGGGLAIAAGFSGTDLAPWIGNQLLALEGASYFTILLASGLLALGITQIAPNTATTTVLVPISATLAQAIGYNPIPVMTITALGAGFALMMPIGTPSLAIVYASGKLTLKEMMITGLWVAIFALVLMMLFIYFVFPAVMGIDPLTPVAKIFTK